MGLFKNKEGSLIEYESIPVKLWDFSTILQTGIFLMAFLSFLLLGFNSMLNSKIEPLAFKINHLEKNQNLILKELKKK